MKFFTYLLLITATDVVFTKQVALFSITDVLSHSSCVENVQQSIFRVMVKYFPTKHDLIVVKSEHILDNFLKNLNNVWVVQVIARSRQVVLEHGTNFRSFLLILTSEKQLLQMNKSVLKSTDRLFIVIDSSSETQMETARKILEYLWDNCNILDVLVMVGDDKHLYTWYPFHSTGRQVMWLDPQSLPILDKIPNKFYNTTLTVKTYEVIPGNYYVGNHSGRLIFEGPEIDIINTVMEQLNISYSIIAGEVHNMSAIIGLNKREFDIFFASIPLFAYLASYFDTTIPYFTSAYKWYVPCPSSISRLKRLLTIFEPSVLMLMLILMVTVTFVMWRLGRYYNDSNNFCNSLITAWATSVGISVPIQPINHALRMVFIFWVSYCYALNTIFQTFFTTNLVNPGTYQKIKNSDDICNKSFEFGYDFRLDYLLFDANSKWMCNGVGRTDCKGNTNSDCFYRVVKNDDFAYLGAEFYGEYYVTVNLARNADALCSLDDYFATLHIVMYLTSGSHFLKPINTILMRILEAGIKSKMMRVQVEKWRIRSGYNKGIDIRQDDSEFVIFTLTHLSIVFYILFGGLVFSFVVFILEITTKWKRIEMRILNVA
ncbi:hypothetical protein L9F63_021097 [Diploptera punctata]|uniref:Uncharacterized protein n=1 Tax=Diploptera punctata TaxID=6984 RepID=A0AAD7ZRK3_DIPPU|nr:hypothetical protein L9F63_021097 [Diploptera punctata]